MRFSRHGGRMSVPSLAASEPTGFAGRPGRAVRIRTIEECRCEPALRRIAERLAEIVGDRTARYERTDRAGGILRRESVAVVAEARRIDAAELDREIGRAAIVVGVEAIGLAAGRRTDFDHIDADAAQAVDDRFARRAGAGAAQ